MRSLPLALLTITLLGGCAGNAIDYIRPRAEIVGPELIRYGFDPGASECVGGRLSTRLNPLQLRLLARSAGAVTRGYADPARLTPPDLAWVATSVKDPKVGVEVAEAVSSCAATVASAAQAAPNPAATPTVSLPAAAAAVPGAPPRVATWVNLGAAATGQSIAVDAASIEKEAAFGRGWFRLTNPGAAPSNASYLLRIDCPAKTITTFAHQKTSPTGVVEERRDYGPNGEGPLPVETGTVMEIAYLSLCT